MIRLPPHASDPQLAARRYWMAVLAKALPDEIETAWRSLGAAPRYRCLRGPEMGLVMLRGRVGGTGMPFNLGEATVARCVVALAAGGAEGYAYVRGSDLQHAERAAVLDALLQNGDAEAAALVERLAAAAEGRRRRNAAELAATRVEFFTMVRE
jgi:alpha-D-ribose 1-methylphosphonate 5-triphosphate synthase subunit PhnG